MSLCVVVEVWMIVDGFSQSDINVEALTAVLYLYFIGEGSKVQV